MSHYRSYFAARALEERQLAMASIDPRVRRVHLEMAARYTLSAAANATVEIPPEKEQRTA